MKPNRVRIGSRGSRLAIVQARQVQSLLASLHPNVNFDIITITTTGDRNRKISLAQLGGEGVFVKELEDALLSNAIDLAVHSLKDMLTTVPKGLQLTAVPPRADPRDVIVSPHGGLANLPEGAKIGTSSLRRQVQLLAKRPDIEIRELRGNIETRLRKAFNQLDGVIMAGAALHRLGMQDQISEYLDPEEFVPAVGQGALGIETRQSDEMIRDIVAPLNDELTWQAVTAERTFLSAMGGGCRAPISALGMVRNGALSITAQVASPDGQRMLTARIEGDSSLPEEVGYTIAQKMLELGAGNLIDKGNP